MKPLNLCTFWLPVLGLLLCLPGSALASSNETLGFDPRSVAMGGAAAGVADTPSAWYYNPAGLAQIRGGWQELGMAQIPFIGLKQRDSRDGPWLDNTTPVALGVYFPGCNNYGLKNVTIGLGGGTVFGSFTYWSPTEGNLRFGNYETMTIVNTLSPAVGVRLAPWLMVGATFNIVGMNKLTSFNKVGDGFFGEAVRDTVRGKLGIPAGQASPIDGILDALGVDSRNGRDDGKLEVETDRELPTGIRPINDMNLDFRDFSYNLGVLVQPTDRLRIGVTYREKTYVHFEGEVRLVWEEDAKGIVNGNPLLVALNGGPIQSESARFQMLKTMPRMLVLGASYRLTDRLLLAGDVQWTNWASAATAETTLLEGQGIMGTTQSVTVLDYVDTVSVRVGAEVLLWQGLRCQAGYWWDPCPVPDRTINANNMDSDRHAFSFGLGYRGLLNGLLDLSTVVQYIHFTERHIAPYESIDLGGMKNYESKANDFPLDFKGHVLNLGFLIGIHF